MTDQKHLFPRKGGGGRGGSGGGRRSGGSSSGKGNSSPASRARSTAKKYGASDTFVNSRGSTPIGITGTGSTSYAYSPGGGDRIILGGTSAFGGREAGGGSRSTIYGTSHFGSGYPYGGYGTFVSGRPLPYYYYPVPCYHNYYGGDEYVNVSDSKRPGRNLVTALIQPSYNTSSVIYRIVGDNSSVVVVFDALVANCSVTNSSSAFARFEPSNTWPLPEQIIQYYRASSFALSLDGYNNTATLPSNAPPSNQSQLIQIPDTPLPSGLNGTFLQCVNQTIGASVPLAEPERKGLSRTAIGGIVAGAIFGTFFLCLFACCCYSSRRRKREQKSTDKSRGSVDDVPDIYIDSDDVPAYTPACAKDLNRGGLAKSRPASIDGHTLVGDSSGRKERWSYASSSTSSRNDVSDTVDNHPSGQGQGENQSSHGTPSDHEVNKPSWSSRIPLIGRFNRSRTGKHQSTPSVHELLTEVPRHSRELKLEDSRGRRDSRSLSPSRSPYSSRSPSPSPTTAKFPLMSGEDKPTLG